MAEKESELEVVCACWDTPLFPALCDRHGLQPARLLCPWGFSKQEYWSGLPCPPPGDFPNPGIQPRSPALHTDSLSSEPPGKPKNRVGSLSFLKRIFTIQGSNWGLLHCRWILYQLSYKGSPSLRLSQYKSPKLKSKENKDWKKKKREREYLRTVGQLQKM